MNRAPAGSRADWIVATRRKHVVADATFRGIEQLIKDQLQKLSAIQPYGRGCENPRHFCKLS